MFKASAPTLLLSKMLTWVKQSSVLVLCLCRQNVCHTTVTVVHRAGLAVESTRRFPSGLEGWGPVFDW